MPPGCQHMGSSTILLLLMRNREYDCLIAKNAREGRKKNTIVEKLSMDFAHKSAVVKKFFF